MSTYFLLPALAFAASRAVLCCSSTWGSGSNGLLGQHLRVVIHPGLFGWHLCRRSEGVAAHHEGGRKGEGARADSKQSRAEQSRVESRE
jgi:hypothetical protein